MDWDVIYAIQHLEYIFIDPKIDYEMIGDKKSP